MTLAEALSQRFLSRTWPYGTRRTVRIITSTPELNLIIAVDAMTPDSEQEGYILIGEPDTAEIGDVRTIEFREGGPTGGHWKLLERP